MTENYKYWKCINFIITSKKIHFLQDDFKQEEEEEEVAEHDDDDNLIVATDYSSPHSTQRKA